MSQTYSPAVKAALLGAIKDAIDGGSAAGYVAFYDASLDELGRVVLAKPCGTVAGGKLPLGQADAGADLVLVSGTAATARIYNSDDALVLSGAVTGAGGAGPFKIGGANGVDLLQGAALVLSGLVIE